MIQHPIYKPRGRALEYADYALNIYRGCPHRCTYCFAPDVLRKTKEEFHSNCDPRKEIIKSVEKQLNSTDEFYGKEIHLCFCCDPYPNGYDAFTTRAIIHAIKTAGAHVQILTKGGKQATNDFDLLDSNDSFGVTISCNDDLAREYEPGAALPSIRTKNLELAHDIGIKTWVSCEPVLDTEAIYNLIRYGNYIDLFRIGKLNHIASSINWPEFGKIAEHLCKRYNRDYYIKEDLRAEMERSGF